MLSAFLALGDPFQVPEVPESLVPGSDHDEQVGIAGGRGRERMHRTGRNYEQVALACGQDTVAGEQLCGPGHDVEQLAGAVVVVRAAPLAPPASMIRWQLSAPPVALASA